MSQLTQRALLLAFAGFASAVFADVTSKLGMGIGWFYPGLVFGVAIAAVLVLHSGVRSPWKLTGFVAASTVAYPISIAAVMLTDVIRNSRDSGLPTWGIFIAGCLGALIVYLAAFVLLAPANSTWGSTIRPFLWSLVGGVLGVIGFLASGAIPAGDPQNSGNAVQDPVLSAVWQTGVALCAAFVLPVENRRAPAEEAPHRSRPNKMLGGLLFGATLALFGYLVLRILP